MIEAISVVLLLLLAVDLWCCGVLWVAAVRHPHVVLLRSELERALIVTCGAVSIGALAVNVLLGFPWGHKVDFVMLVIGVLLFSMPLAYFLFNYYRGRFNGK